MSQKRFSRDGFRQLPESESTLTMSNPNDATIDIPLTNVKTNTGARKGDMAAYGSGTYSEKMRRLAFSVEGLQGGEGEPRSRRIRRGMMEKKTP